MIQWANNSQRDSTILVLVQLLFFLGQISLILQQYFVYVMDEILKNFIC